MFSKVTKRFHVVAAAALLGSVAACSQAPGGASSEAREDASPVAAGEWTVDGAASKMNYISIKSGEIAEVNRFETLSGSVSADGVARIEIDLSSVSTGVDIRDERMRDIFFDVAQNPTASVTAQLDPAAFETLGIGESMTQMLDATLTVKGVEAPIQTEVTVTRVTADRVLAASNDPVIVYADALQLTGGLAQLQELAGLPSITPAVPVTFAIVFERLRSVE
jgi:polyisoprenoid-binding protein YceI